MANLVDQLTMLFFLCIFPHLCGGQRSIALQLQHWENALKSTRTFALAAAALAAAALSSTASAAIVTYIGADDGVSSPGMMTNSNAAAASFDAATGSLSKITFESGLPAGVSIVGGSTTNNSGCGALCGFNITPSGSMFRNLFGGSMTISFASAIDSFGFYVTGLQTNLVPQETVTFSDGSSQVINVPNAINGGGAFIGFTDIGKSIVSVTYNATNDIVSIDDIRYGNAAAAVPEPSTYALMLLGLGMAGVVARRQKR
jgi:hypothetical protein